MDRDHDRGGLSGDLEGNEVKRDSFVFYRSFMDAIEQLDDSQHLEVLRAIIEYALEGTMPKKKCIASAILMSVKPVIDKNNTSYENGKKGGRPKTQPKPNDNPTVTQPKPNDNPTVTDPEPYVDVDVDADSDVDADADADADVEAPQAGGQAGDVPTEEEVTEFAKSIGFDIDAKHFIEYYLKDGRLQVNGEPVRDWKALVRSWWRQEQKSREQRITSADVARKKPNGWNSFDQRTDDLDDETIQNMKRQYKEFLRRQNEDQPEDDGGGRVA